jgi:hypothetical protein
MVVHLARNLRLALLRLDGECAAHQIFRDLLPRRPDPTSD